MANEINISAVPGLTLSLQLYKGLVSVGVAFGASEIGLTGEYVASMPSGVPYGQYLIIATAGDIKIASGQIIWDGSYEMPIGLSMLAGLDPSNPMTAKATERKSGDIDLKVDGYGSPLTTVTRQ